MCNAGAIGLGLQGAGVVGNTITRIADNKARNDYENYNNQLLFNNYARQTRELNNSYSQDRLTEAMRAQQVYLQNLQRRATAQAGAAGAGVTGNSLENLMRGYDRASAVNNYLAARNLNIMGLEYNDRLSNLRYSALNTLIRNQYNSSNYQYNNALALLKGVNDMSNLTVNYVSKKYRNNNGGPEYL